jgi:hypothetical protein
MVESGVDVLGALGVCVCFKVTVGVEIGSGSEVGVSMGWGDGIWVGAKVDV